MNWHNKSKIIFSLAAVSQLLLPPLEAIAHSGHQHEREQKSAPQPPSESRPVVPKEPESTPRSTDGVAPVLEVNPSNSTPLIVHCQ